MSYLRVIWVRVGIGIGVHVELKIPTRLLLKFTETDTHNAKWMGFEIYITRSIQTAGTCCSFACEIIVGYEQSRIEKLIPGVRNTRKAPMAAILEHSRASWDFPLPVNWRVPILSVVCHPCNVEIKHWRLHFCYDRFKHSHHPWICCNVCVTGYGLHFAMAGSPSVPLPFPITPKTQVIELVIILVHQFGTTASLKVTWSEKLSNRERRLWYGCCQC